MSPINNLNIISHQEKKSNTPTEYELQLNEKEEYRLTIKILSIPQTSGMDRSSYERFLSLGKPKHDDLSELFLKVNDCAVRIHHYVDNNLDFERYLRCSGSYRGVYAYVFFMEDVPNQESLTKISRTQVEITSTILAFESLNMAQLEGKVFPENTTIIEHGGDMRFLLEETTKTVFNTKPGLNAAMAAASSPPNASAANDVKRQPMMGDCVVQ